jgi:anti-sigma-K factor RskA
MNERELLAAEHALRLLAGEELMEAHRLEADDPVFRAEVEAWNVRLAPLLNEIAPVEPGPGAWERIERALAEPQQSADVITLRRKVRQWQALSGLAAAVATVLALVTVPPLLTPPAAPPANPQSAPVLIASLGDPDAPGAVAVTFVPAQAELLVTVSAIQREVGRDHQLWIIPAGGSPISLGLAPADQSTKRRVPQALARQFRAGAIIALSLEPTGGSPTGQPTGPVVASGPLQTV